MFDTQASWAREELSGDRKYSINYQGEYVKELISQTDCPGFDVDGACKVFCQWKKYKSVAIMKFRNNTYRAFTTGSMAPIHHTAWAEALDEI